MAVTQKVTVTIAASGTTSAAVAVGAGVPVGIAFPAALTGTAVTFQVSQDGVTYRNLYDAGAAYSVTFTASVYEGLKAALFAGAAFVKVVSNGTEAAERTIELVTRRGDA